ncbi:MAG: outer membrane beta-barrel family protein [Bacteroides sp.]|nr:outer membrane beta-barrel family protein [Roseburia sp.]MCM1346848.1 outer membrane beta-barrel family protein [Bacteroides sp.]MCM1419936.1 outer membrane beta-barrel family protein [Bacteroides sp.]
MEHGLLICLSFFGYGLKAHGTHSSPQGDSDGRDSVCCRMVVDNDSISYMAFTETFVADATGYTVSGEGIPWSDGKNAAEILSLLPGVENEGEGFTVNGLPVTEIQVNGLAILGREELEVVPSSYVENIDVDYLSGSDKNVNVAGGLIRIRLKEPESHQWYGSLRASGTFSPHYSTADGNVGGMMFGKGRKWTFYHLMWLDRDKTKSEEEEQYDYTLYGQGGGIGDFRNHSFTRNDAYTLKDRFSLVYNADRQNSLTANMYFSHTGLRPEVVTDVFGNTTPSHTLLKDDIKGNVYLGTLKYICSLEESEAVFEVSADYMHIDERTHETLSDGQQEVVEMEDGVSDDEKSTWFGVFWKKRSDQWSLGTSFSRRIEGLGTFKIGASASVVTSVVNPGYETSAIDRTETKAFTPFVYATLTGKWKSADYILGLNSQWNRIEYQNYTKHHKDENRQWCLNPTFQLVCPIDTKRGHALKIAYKHTMDNIPYDAINTELRYNNVNSYIVGNPALTAAKSDLAMAVLSLNRGMLRFCMFYDRAVDIIRYATYREEGGSDLFYTMPVNCKRIESWGFSAETRLSPLFFWNVKTSVMVRMMKENALVGELVFNGTHPRYNLNMDNDFVLGRDMGASVCFGFEPAFRSLDRKYHALWNLQCGFYKSFLNKRLNVTAHLNLLRHTRTYDTESSVFNLCHRDMTHRLSAEISAVWCLGK